MAVAAVKAVPNVLSSLRIALAIVFPMLSADWRLPALMAGGLSDWIDGLVARRYKAITASGTLLDAIADKLFTLSVLVTVLLEGAYSVQWWQVALILSRDLSVAAMVLHTVAMRRYDAFWHMRPRLPGKLTTTLVFLWLMLVLANTPAPWQGTLFVLAAAASVMAGLDYLLQFLRRYEEVRVSRP